MVTRVRVKKTIINDEMDATRVCKDNGNISIRLDSRNTDEFIELKVTPDELAMIEKQIEHAKKS